MTSLAGSFEETIQTSRLARKLNPSAGVIAGMIGPSSVDVFSLGIGVDARTPMEIGSLTKIFTALLIAEAVRRDELELSTCIDKFLFGVQWPGQGISVEQLATHTSGLPRLGLPIWKLFSTDPYRNVSRGNLMTYLQQRRPRSPSVHRYLYSNLGYAVLGLMAEKATSRPYADLLEERLFRQLGLTRTLLQLASGSDLAAPGYGTTGKSEGLWRWDAYAPCGGLVSSFDDLALLVQSFLDPGGSLADALALTTRPNFALKHGGHVGLGWMLPPDGDSFWHNGGTRGYSSYLGVDSKQKLGIVVLVNQGLAKETTELGTALMRLIHGNGALLQGKVENYDAG
jgi:CubicO group peptidase (beta-lactamase class C family)